MKSLAWKYEKGKFDSPAWGGFYWDKEGLTSAKCGSCGDEMPRLECSCGLYASFRWEEVSGYRYTSQISPIILFEVSGKCQFYQDCIRAKQLAPFAVIEEQGADEIWHLAALQAADYFDVPTIPKSTGIALMDVWNITWFTAHQGEPYNIPYWREWYEPESDNHTLNNPISKLSDEWIEHFAQQILGGEICKSNRNISTCTEQGA